jgi:hypothetical protein
MNSVEFNKIIDILAVKIFYPKDGEICFTIATRNKNYYKNNKYNFFDLIENKHIFLENVLNFEILFSSHIPFFNIYNNKAIDSSIIETQIEWNIKYITELKKINKHETTLMCNKLKKMSFEDIVEYCYEVLFFKPSSTLKEDIIVECKQRKKFLLRTIDHGIFSKILALFEINDEDFIKQDVSLIAKCKKKWKDVIKFYINKAKLKLKEEVDNNKENTDLIIEVTEISKILDDITNEIDLKEFKSPKDIAKYWPDILRPSPIYVINND